MSAWALQLPFGLTDSEDAPEAAWLRCASHVFIDSVVINRRWIMSLILNEPSAEVSIDAVVSRWHLLTR